MFDPLPSDSQAHRPTAEEIFTDRKEERKLLRETLSPTPTPPNETTKFLTVFYGVGGVGKSTLCEQAHAIIREHSGPHLKAVFVDFEHDSKCTPESGAAEVLGEIIRAFAAQEVKVRLSLTLLTLHAQRDARNLQSPASVDDGWALTMDALDKVVEGMAFPGLNLGVKVLQKIWDKSAQSKLREELTRHNLWPLEQHGKINLKDLEEKIARAIAVDITLHLQADPTRHLRLIIDGFERIQSRQETPDGQKRLQQMLGWLAQSQDREVWSRFRVVMFGRNCITWDKRYRWDEWCRHWNTHLLKGLSEADALELLGKYEQWYRRNQGVKLADAVRKHAQAILDAADEQELGQRVIYPYYVDLAVDLVLRCTASDSSVDLGHCPSDLEQRFFSNVPPDELHLLKVLALGEDFDENLYDWLAQARLISQSRGQFRTALGLHHHSYFRKCDPEGCTWQFHALFKKALQSKWLASEDDRRDGSKVVHQLLGYYGQPVKEKSEQDWTEDDVESWRRGMEIIVAQGMKLGLLSAEQWKPVLAVAPWSLGRFRAAALCLDFTRHILQEQERGLGPQHLETLRSVHKIGVLQDDMWDCAEAEVMYRRAIMGFEKSLGSEHPTTLCSIAKLGNLLAAQRLLTDRSDVNAEAEAFLRRALAGREKALGLEHPDTLRSLHSLGNLLGDKGDYITAEALLCRELAGWEKVCGPKHPESLSCLYNLGLLLRCKGDFAGAVVLYRRELAGCEEVRGPEHTTTLNSINVLAKVLWENANYAEAIALYRRALVGWEKTLGPEHSETLATLCELGDLLRHTGDLTGALTTFRHWTAKAGKCSLKLRYDLARLECLSGSFDEAKRLIAEEIAAKPWAREQALEDDDLKAIRDFIQTLQPADDPQKSKT